MMRSAGAEAFEASHGRAQIAVRPAPVRPDRAQSQCVVGGLRPVRGPAGHRRGQWDRPAVVGHR